MASRLVSRNGISFCVKKTPRYESFWNGFADGSWEPETLAIFDEYIRPEDTFFDIGSWIGPTALYAAATAKRVICVEPDPIAAAELRANIAANPSLASRITIIEAAVSRRPGTLRLGSRQEGGDSTSSLLFPDGMTIWNVPSITPAALLAQAPDEPIFIKMDIEGGEYFVLPDAAWARGDATMLVSMHPRFLRQSQPFLSAAALLGRATMLRLVRRGQRLHSKLWLFSNMSRQAPAQGRDAARLAEDDGQAAYRGGRHDSPAHGRARAR